MLLQDFEKKNSLLLSNTRCKITEKYKKRRQVLHQLRKQNKKVNSNTPGGFSTKLIPHFYFTSQGSGSKIQAQDVCKTITFVDVQAYITELSQ